MTLNEVLTNEKLTNSIIEMQEIYEQEPQTEYKEKYKGITIEYFRTTQTGVWTSLITIPQFHFKYKIPYKKGKKKGQYHITQKLVPLPTLLKKYPQITYVRPGNIDNHNIIKLGITSISSLPPYNTNKFITTLYNNTTKLSNNPKIYETIINLKYTSLKSLITLNHDIIKFLYDFLTPPQLKTFKCQICKHPTNLMRIRYIDGDRNKKICRNCYIKLQNNTFIPKSKIRKGKFYTEQRNNQIYYACHICGYLTPKLFTHTSHQHKIDCNEYSQKYNIDLIKNYYKDYKSYHSTELKKQKKKERLNNND